MIGRGRRPEERGRGYTLIELLMVIVTLGIAAAAIVMLQGNIFSRRASMQDLQIGTQLIQDCSERLLATSRSAINGLGYNANALSNGASASSLCAGSTVNSGGVVYGAPQVNLIVGNSTTIGPCPITSESCKLLSVTQGGLAPVTLLLVQ